MRTALRLKEGDDLRYEIVDDRVILTKARQAAPAVNGFGMFDEWAAEADERAYRNL